MNSIHFDITIRALAVVLGTLGVLLQVLAIELISVVIGGVAFGLLLGRAFSHVPSPDRADSASTLGV